MKQTTLANEDFEPFRKPMWREKFFGEMDKLVPRAELVAMVERFYPRVRPVVTRSA